MGTMCVKFGVIALTLSYWSLEVQHVKELSENLKKIIVALHKDGVDYEKIAAARWPRLYSSLTGQVPLRKGLAMVNQRS